MSLEEELPDLQILSQEEPQDDLPDLQAVSDEIVEGELPEEVVEEVQLMIGLRSWVIGDIISTGMNQL